MDHLSATPKKRISVLMTGAGAPGGPGIIKALRRGAVNLFTGDCNPFASGRFLNDKFVELPKAGDDAFIPFVLDFSLRNGIDVVFPLVTMELFKFAKHKEEFLANGIRVLVSDFANLSLANDKGALYTHLHQHKIPVPAFRLVSTVDELADAAFALGYPQKAVCVKPAVSNGSRGVRILQQNVDEFELLFHYKPNNLYSNLEKITQTLAGKSFPELLVSDHLPGDEYTVDTIVKNGRPQLILPRIRTKMSGGISVQGTFVKQDEIIAYCDGILRTLHLSGPIGLQVKADAQGRYRILEINPRIQGTSVAALGLDVNLPLLAVMQEFEEIDFRNVKINWGKSFVRYYEEVFY